MAGVLGIKEARERYVQLWDRVIERFNRQRRKQKLPDVSQGDIADRLDVSQAAVSRIVRGNELPRSADLLMKLAKEYGARTEESRVLLVYSNAIIAADAGELEVASCFLTMFQPLFSEHGLTRKVIRPREVAYQVLLDLKVAPAKAVRVAELLQDETSLQDAMGQIIGSLADEGLDDLLNNTQLRTVVTAFNTYKQVAVVDFDSPFAEISPFLRKAELRGDCKARLWRAIPNLAVTRIDVEPSRSIKDRSHPGYEFIFVERGDGDFVIQGLEPIPLSTASRQLIAYRPSAAHTFTAGAKGARLYVISYLRQGDRKVEAKYDPVQDVLTAAQNNS